jgi:hypothetical protein
MSNSLNPAENCPSKADTKLFGSARRQAIENSTLNKYDEQQQREIIANRMSNLMRVQVPPGTGGESDPPPPLVRTKFDSDANYLWNMCHYFDEPAEAFYVRSFLELGRVAVGHRIFIDKPEQVIISFVVVYLTSFFIFFYLYF